MTLTYVTDDEVKAAQAHISVILQGPEKVGKSTAAASAPSPILYLNADAPSRLRHARRHNQDADIREVRIRPGNARATFDETVLTLRDGKTDVQTVVVDPLARAYECVLFEIGGLKPQIQHHGDAQSYMERFVLALLELPVHVVLVAHDHPYEMGTTEDGRELKELLPFCGSSTNPALAKKLMRPVDVIAYCGLTRNEETGEVKQVAQLYRGHGRRAGDGLGVLGATRELNLSEWVAVNEAAQNKEKANA